MTCGHVQPVTGAAALVCELEAGHALPHATLNAGAVVARWPVEWTAADEASYQARHAAAVEERSKKR